jgi:hypothetical protein
MGGPPAAEVEEDETMEASSSIIIAEDAGTAMDICCLFLSLPSPPWKKETTAESLFCERIEGE